MSHCVHNAKSISNLWILVAWCWVSTDRMLIYLIQSTKMKFNRWSMKTTQWLSIAYLQEKWQLIFRSTSNQCVMQYCVTESPPQNLSQNIPLNSNSLSCVNGPKQRTLFTLYSSSTGFVLHAMNCMSFLWQSKRSSSSVGAIHDGTWMPLVDYILK